MQSSEVAKSNFEQKGANIVKRIGNTTYRAYIHFSETSKENFTDKVMRLVKNDTIFKE